MVRDYTDWTNHHVNIDWIVWMWMDTILTNAVVAPHPGHVMMIVQWMTHANVLVNS